MRKLAWIVAMVLLGTWAMGDNPAAQPSIFDAPPAKTPREVVFAWDSDGSMMWRAKDVKAELAKAISNLTHHDLFGLVVLQNGEAKPLFDHMVVATDANVKRAQKFLANTDTGGNGDAAAILHLAIRMRPAELWFLSDGEWPDTDQVFKTVSAQNSKIHAKINTVGSYAPDGDPSLRENLWKLANSTGGRCIDAKGNDMKEPRPKN